MRNVYKQDHVHVAQTYIKLLLSGSHQRVYEGRIRHSLAICYLNFTIRKQLISIIVCVIIMTVVSFMKILGQTHIGTCCTVNTIKNNTIKAKLDNKSQSLLVYNIFFYLHYYPYLPNERKKTKRCRNTKYINKQK